MSEHEPLRLDENLYRGYVIAFHRPRRWWWRWLAGRLGITYTASVTTASEHQDMPRNVRVIR